MSDTPPVSSTVLVDIAAWIDKAKADLAAYIERQATEVFLAALGMTKPYAHEIFFSRAVC